MLVVRELKHASTSGVVRVMQRPNAHRAKEPVWFWIMVGVYVFFLLFGMALGLLGTYLLIESFGDAALRAEMGLW